MPGAQSDDDLVVHTLVFPEVYLYQAGRSDVPAVPARHERDLRA